MTKNIDWEDVIRAGERNLELLRQIHLAMIEFDKNQEIIQQMRFFVPSDSDTVKPLNRKKNPIPVSNGSPLPNPKQVSKTKFVEACFESNPKTNPKTINRMWVDGGGDGTISHSLVYKIKHDLSKKPKLVAAAAAKRETAVLDDVTHDVKKVVWDLISEKPMTIGDIVIAIEDNDLLDPIPNNLEVVVKEAVNEFRDDGKATRGRNRCYSIIEGASID